MWVWAGSRHWWWTGKPGVLQSMGSQRVGHDWATELNWEMHQSFPSLFIWPTSANWVWFQLHFLKVKKVNFSLSFWHFSACIWKVDFPGGWGIKNLPANAGDAGSIPGLRRYPGGENGNPLQHSCLENPIDMEYGQLQFLVSQSQTQLSNWACVHMKSNWVPMNSNWHINATKSNRPSSSDLFFTCIYFLWSKRFLCISYVEFY